MSGETEGGRRGEEWGRKDRREKDLGEEADQRGRGGERNEENKTLEGREGE